MNRNLWFVRGKCGGVFCAVGIFALTGNGANWLPASKVQEGSTPQLSRLAVQPHTGLTTDSDVLVVPCLTTATVSTSTSLARLRVVVLPFENVSGDAELDPWSQALPAWVRSCLDSAELTEVLGNETTQKMVKRLIAAQQKVNDRKLAERIANELEADVAVWGDFRRSANEWTARASLLRLDMEAVLADLDLSAPGWVALSESLTLRIASILGRKIPDGERERWTRRMAHSEPAQRYLAQAMAMAIEHAPPLEEQKVLRQVLVEDPRCAVARVMMFPLLTQRELEEAAREAVRQTPDDCNAHVAATSSYLDKEDLEGAKRELQQAVRLHHGCPTAAEAMFLMLAPRGHWQELATMLEPIHQANPGNSVIVILLAAARAQCGESDAVWDLLAEVNALPDENQMVDLALFAAAATGGRWDLVGRELTRLGPQAGENERVRQSLASLHVTFSPEGNSNLPIVKPRVYTPAGLTAELELRLSADERSLVVNPLETSPEIIAVARRLTIGLSNATSKALALFGEVARRGRGRGNGGARTATEALKDSDQVETRLSCQEHAKLFVALARAVGLEAWMVHVERGADGLPCYHDCAALFLEGQGLLVDPTWRVFGIGHEAFTVLDDVQTIAHQALQPTKELPDPRRLRAGLKLDPGDLWTQLQFVRGMARAGEYAAAESELCKVRSVEAERWDVYEAAAELETARERWNAALTQLEKALVLNPSNAIVHFQLSKVYAAQGQLAKSAGHMERALVFNRGEISREFGRQVSSEFTAIKAFIRTKAGDSTARVELQRLAEAGDVAAQEGLAKIYFEARRPEIELGLRWNLKAAEQGDAQAQLDYAKNLLIIRGREAGKEAALWLKRSAEQGNPEAQYRLGLALYEGKLIPRDNVAACQWTILSATAGDKEAKQLLREMELFLTASELATAHERARNFKRWQNPH